MRYHTAVFDLDGTLLDTLQDLADSTNYALSVNGLPGRTLDEIRRFVGNGVGKLIARAVPDGTPEALTAKCLSDFRAHYFLNMENKTAPTPASWRCWTGWKGGLPSGHCVQQVRQRRQGPVPDLFR